VRRVRNERQARVWTASAAGDSGRGLAERPGRARLTRVSERLGSRAARGAGECSARRLRPTRRRDRSDRRRRSLPYLQARAHQRRIEFRPFFAARLWPCPFRPAARLASPVRPWGIAPVEDPRESRAARRGGIRRTVAIRGPIWAGEELEPDSGGCPNSLRPRVCQAIAEVKAHNLSPLCALPPMPPPSFTPAPRSPHAADLPCPPAAFLAAFSRGAAAPLRWTLAARGRRSGMAAPLAATAPPLARRCAALSGGGPSSPLARLRVELARGALARLRLGRCPRRPRGPVPCGQSGPREDRRGSSRRSAALLFPRPRSVSGGFGWGRARRCGTRQLAASPTPPPIRAHPDTLRGRDSLTRVVQIRLTADFQRRLSVRAFQGHFLGKIGRFWAYGGPRASISPKKLPQKALQGRLQLAPSVPLRVKLGATCLTAAYLPGADSGPRPMGAPRHDLSIL